MITKLQKLAGNVVDMFDQANTGKVIERLGHRGNVLKQAIEDLRREVNKKQKVTILTWEQANEPLITEK
jgi:hypothetical protein